MGHFYKRRWCSVFTMGRIPSSLILLLTLIQPKGAAVEGKWKEGHVPDTSLVQARVRWRPGSSLAVRGATPVTLCSHYCTGEGCNSASLPSPPPILLLPLL